MKQVFEIMITVGRDWEALNVIKNVIDQQQLKNVNHQISASKTITAEVVAIEIVNATDSVQAHANLSQNC